MNKETFSKASTLPTPSAASLTSSQFRRRAAAAGGCQAAGTAIVALAAFEGQALQPACNKESQTAIRVLRVPEDAEWRVLSSEAY